MNALFSLSSFIDIDFSFTHFFNTMLSQSGDQQITSAHEIAPKCAVFIHFYLTERYPHLSQDDRVVIDVHLLNIADFVCRIIFINYQRAHFFRFEAFRASAQYCTFIDLLGKPHAS